MLTSALVLIRKQRLELWSVRNNRRLGEWPATLIAESDWPSRFPLSSKVVDISWCHRQKFSGTSRAIVMRNLL